MPELSARQAWRLGETIDQHLGSLLAHERTRLATREAILDAALSYVLGVEEGAQPELSPPCRCRDPRALHRNGEAECEMLGCGCEEYRPSGPPEPREGE